MGSTLYHPEDQINTRGTERNSTRVKSEAVQAVSEKRALSKPVTVTGISLGKLITVTPTMFAKLDVDPTYQRGATVMVGQIIRAIQNGGAVLDPVTLCERRGSPTWWIVDGYQRVCAYQQLGVEFQAMLHTSHDVEAEKRFFIALNARNALNPNIIVRAWTGPSASMLRAANKSPEHPLYERVNFTQSSNESRLSASMIVRGSTGLISNKINGRIDRVLSRMDTAIAMDRDRGAPWVDNYYRLVGRVSEKGHLPGIVLKALATVARERWTETGVQMPHPKVIERLKGRQWGAEVVLVEKYMPVLVEQVRKLWR